MMRITLHALLCLSRHWRGKLVAPEAKQLSRQLRAGDVAIDVGAHCGSWMIPLSGRLGAGRVYAIEALPHYAAVLRRLATWLGCGNVTVLTGAATDRKMQLPLVWKTAAGRRLTGLTHAAGVAESTDGALMVPGLPLDKWIPEADWARVKLIKCDIEGAELAAFRGAEGILTQARPVVFCEINEGFCRRYGHRAADVFAFFEERGYQAFTGREGCWEQMCSEQYPGKGDVLFVPPGHDLVRA